MAIEDFTKRCAKCHAEKALCEFYKLKRNQEGRRSVCKVCDRVSKRLPRRQWYYKNLDGNKMKHKEWRDALRQKAKEYFSDICFLCGKKVFVKVSDFNIHHKYSTNNHKGHAVWHPEDWGQCVLLCKGCHYMLHGVNRLPKDKFSSLLSKL